MIRQCLDDYTLLISNDINLNIKGDFMEIFKSIISTVNGYLYYPVLIIILLACGFYFTIRTGFIQFTLFSDAVKVVGGKTSRRR